MSTLQQRASSSQVEATSLINHSSVDGFRAKLVPEQPLHQTPNTPIVSASSSKIMEDSNHRRKRKRRVTFPNDTVVTGCAPSLFSTLTKELAEEIWYQPPEVASMKSTTRKLVIYGKQEEQDDLSGLERFNMERSQHKKQTIQCVILTSQRQRQRQQRYLRGKQQKYQQNFLSTFTPSTQCVTSSLLDLPAEPASTTSSPNQLNPPKLESSSSDFLRVVSKQCTAISTDMALTQGFNDFCQVYDPLQSLFGEKNDDGDNYNDVFFGGEGELRHPHRSRVHKSSSTDCMTHGNRATISANKLETSQTVVAVDHNKLWNSRV